jgi:HPt (histidine-containing phosphotransfer) domain-containing protein
MLNAPVNKEQLLAATEDDREGLRRLLGIYIHETQHELPLLRAAVETGNAAEVRRLAHGMAGGSMTYGMVAIAPPLRALEEDAKQSNLSHGLERVAEAEAQFARILAFVNEWIAEL